MARIRRVLLKLRVFPVRGPVALDGINGPQYGRGGREHVPIGKCGAGVVGPPEEPRSPTTGANLRIIVLPVHLASGRPRPKAQLPPPSERADAR